MQIHFEGERLMLTCWTDHANPCPIRLVSVSFSRLPLCYCLLQAAFWLTLCLSLYALDGRVAEGSFSSPPLRCIVCSCACRPPLRNTMAPSMPTSVAVHPIVLLGVVDHYNRSCKGSKRYAVLFLLVWVDMDVPVTDIGRCLQPGGFREVACANAWYRITTGGIISCAWLHRPRLVVYVADSGHLPCCLRLCVLSLVVPAGYVGPLGWLAVHFSSACLYTLPPSLLRSSSTGCLPRAHLARSTALVLSHHLLLTAAVP